MKLFEIKAADGRLLRHRQTDLASALHALLPGYVVTGEVLGADGDDKGGFLDPIGDGAKSFMRTLLESRGHELAAWLNEQGYRKGDS